MQRLLVGLRLLSALGDRLEVPGCSQYLSQHALDSIKLNDDDARDLKSIEVFWADGTTKLIDKVKISEKLTISHAKLN